MSPPTTVPHDLPRLPVDAVADQCLRALNGDVEIAVSDALRAAIVLQLRLVTLWRDKIRPGQAAPAWADFAVEELKPWLGSLNLVQVMPGGTDFRYVVYGTDLGLRFGDLTGTLVSSVTEPRRSLAMSFYRMLVRAPSPTLGRQSQWSTSRFYYVFRMGLPLSSDGSIIDRVLMHVHVSDLVAQTDDATFVHIG